MLQFFNHNLNNVFINNFYIIIRKKKIFYFGEMFTYKFNT